MDRRVAWAFVAVSVVGMVCAAYLTHLHLQFSSGQGTGSAVCQALSSSGCDISVASKASEILGVPVALIGLTAYLLLAALAAAIALRPDSGSSGPLAAQLMLLTAVSVIFSAFLFGVMVEAGSYCPFCLTMDVVNVVLFACAKRLFVTGGRGVRPAFAPRAMATTAAGFAVLLGGGYAAYASLERHVAPGSGAADENAFVQSCSDVELSILEFSDLQCPHCRKLFEDLEAISKDCGAKTDIRFVHYPLDERCNRFVPKPFHEHACTAAVAAECARQQGKFWSYAAKTFEGQSDLSNEALGRIASEAGLDVNEFNACLSKEQTMDSVRKDIELAHRLGVRATPTFFLNGRRFEGSYPLDRLRAMVQNVLAEEETERKKREEGQAQQ